MTLVFLLVFNVFRVSGVPIVGQSIWDAPEHNDVYSGRFTDSVSASALFNNSFVERSPRGKKNIFH